MNAIAVRVARYASRRCLTTTSTRSMVNSSWRTKNRAMAATPKSCFSPSLASSSPWYSSFILPQSPSPQDHHRSFATASGGGYGGITTDDEPSTSTPPVIPPVIDLESHANADTYDPFEITKSFEDTSYYFPPAEEMDSQFLAAKYEGMTNEELLDSSTIEPTDDLHHTNDDAVHTWDSLMHSPPIRDKSATLPKGTLVGTVVSTKMQKTVNVAVDRYKIHAKYRKRIRYTRKFMAHDEHEVASDGDLVLIVPSQRISKMKHFVLKEILKAKGQL